MKQKILAARKAIIGRGASLLPAGASRPRPMGKQLLVSVLGGGTKTLSGAGEELSTQMTGTADHHRTYGDAKNFYFAA